ncbi:MAG: phosphoenolpyruvate carboxylase [Methanocellales archaeon]|nr:phosphoenolpyruvate carboxylase [Methanocellales archaeon]
MSSQHPDNVTSPFFAEDTTLGGEDEIREAYYAFSHLGCEEQMWDHEGKEVDNFVVKKLLTKYERFFEDNKLGEDVFLTLRVPNPTVEKGEAKILLETLESIPRSFDIAKLFYQEDISPIFEVILPMTTSSKCLNRVYQYYKNFVVGKQNKLFFKGDITIAKWIGEFKPREINVIPLLEEKEHILNAHNIVKEYLKNKKVDYQRVFLARSDPAENYGSTSAILINKIALQRLQELAEQISVDILPIIGAGSAPFRGNFKPTNVDNCLGGYPSVQTFTIQSTFKYDHPEEKVKEAIDEIKRRKRSEPITVDEERCLEIVARISKEYRKQIQILAPLINQVATYVPQRRRRKLHIGLFGYPRSLGKVSLPRAIVFCASLYSIGLPPEILGINMLRDEDIEYFRSIYRGFENDLKDALCYFNKDVLKILPSSLTKRLRLDIVEFETNEEHERATNQIINRLKKEQFSDMQELIIEAAQMRKFLG